MNPLAFKKTPSNDTANLPPQSNLHLMPLPIVPAVRYTMTLRNSKAEVELHDVVQRNWSRVGSGAYRVEGETPTTACFVKQYLDRSGTVHLDHLRYEYEGADVAAALFDGIVTVPAVLGSDETRLVNVFEHCELITIDELLRDDEKLFWRFFPLLLERYGDILQAMREGAETSLGATLPVKARPYRSQGQAINFKGFEVRNTGYKLPLEAGTQDRELTELPPVVMFDFVRPYIAPIEEAAAKLMVSIGLLNWGKPLSRFVTGPDIEMLDMAYYYIGQWTNREAMEAELAIQNGFRFNTIKGATRSETGLKKAGLNIIGRRYMRRLERWSQRQFN